MRKPRPPLFLNVSLVPVSGDFWHAEREICFDRKRVYGSSHHCWNDLLLVRRANRCLKRQLLEVVTSTLPGRKPGRFGACEACML